MYREFCILCFFYLSNQECELRRHGFCEVFPTLRKFVLEVILSQKVHMNMGLILENKKHIQF